MKEKLNLPGWDIEQGFPLGSWVVAVHIITKRLWTNRRQDCVSNWCWGTLNDFSQAKSLEIILCIWCITPLFYMKLSDAFNVLYNILI